MEDVRKKVLTTAKELFIQQGYRKTTIRQIVDHSGILNGSIYNIFLNKESIFKELILDYFDIGDKLVAERFGADISPGLHSALLCSLELIAVELNDRVCELYYEAYHSNIIFEALTYRGTELSQTLFRDYNPTFTYNDYLVRTLAIKGIIRSFITTQYLKKEASFIDRINVLNDMGLHAFNVKPKEIKQIKSDIYRLRKQIEEIVVSTMNEQIASIFESSEI